MSYEKVRQIQIKGDKIFINSACNNCRPLTFSKWEYGSQFSFSEKVKNLFRDILNGNLQPYKNCNYYNEIETCRALRREYAGEYNLFTIDSDYRLNLENELVNIILDYYIEPLFVTKTSVDKITLERKLTTFRLSIPFMISKAEESFKAEGKIIIRSAIYTKFFDGYVLLYSRNGKYILAPNKNYTSGILDNSKNDAIILGSNGWYWSLLGASGFSENTKEEIIDVLKENRKQEFIDFIPEFNRTMDKCKKILTTVPYKNFAFS